MCAKENVSVRFAGGSVIFVISAKTSSAGMQALLHLPRASRGASGVILARSRHACGRRQRPLSEH